MAEHRKHATRNALRLAILEYLTTTPGATALDVGAALASRFPARSAEVATRRLYLLKFLRTVGTSSRQGTSYNNRGRVFTTPKFAITQKGLEWVRTNALVVSSRRVEAPRFDAGLLGQVWGCGRANAQNL